MAAFQKYEWMCFFSFSSLHETIVHEQDSNIEWTCSGLRCIANEMPNTWWEYLCVLEMFTNTKMPIECIATLIKYTHTHTLKFTYHISIYTCVYTGITCACVLDFVIELTMLLSLFAIIVSISVTVFVFLVLRYVSIHASFRW